MAQIFLALGSNIGKREKYLQSAIELLKENGIKILKQSSIYETEPLGPGKQKWYLNQVIEGEAKLTPRKLLKAIKNIEKQLGRKKGQKWGSREIDLDILFYGEEIIDTKKNLTIPHRLLHQRKFILMPLNELAPKFIHPVLKKTIKDILDQCSDELKVIPHTLPQSPPSSPIPLW